MSNKTITLIELFNKMASFDEQENLPEKIKYRNCVFTIIYGEGISPDYMNENSESLLEYVAAQADDLNEIVEIEEQEEIDIQKLGILSEYESFEDYDCRDIGIAITKINQICRRINKLIDLHQENKNRIQQLDKNIKEK